MYCSLAASWNAHNPSGARRNHTLHSSPFRQMVVKSKRVDLAPAICQSWLLGKSAAASWASITVAATSPCDKEQWLMTHAPLLQTAVYDNP